MHITLSRILKPVSPVKAQGLVFTDKPTPEKHGSIWGDVPEATNSDYV